MVGLALVGCHEVLCHVQKGLETCLGVILLQKMMVDDLSGL